VATAEFSLRSHCCHCDDDRVTMMTLMLHVVHSKILVHHVDCRVVMWTESHSAEVEWMTAGVMV